MESLRYSDERLKITKKIAIRSSNGIPPLLYLTLVENAFKHGAGKILKRQENKDRAEANEKIHFQNLKK